jgi:hypothetical protein
MFQLGRMTVIHAAAGEDVHRWSKIWASIFSLLEGNTIGRDKVRGQNGFLMGRSPSDCGSLIYWKSIR